MARKFDGRLGQPHETWLVSARGDTPLDGSGLVSGWPAVWLDENGLVSARGAAPLGGSGLVSGQRAVWLDENGLVSAHAAFWTETSPPFVKREARRPETSPLSSSEKPVTLRRGPFRQADAAPARDEPPFIAPQKYGDKNGPEHALHEGSPRISGEKFREAHFSKMNRGPPGWNSGQALRTWRRTSCTRGPCCPCRRRRGRCGWACRTWDGWPS